MSQNIYSQNKNFHVLTILAECRARVVKLLWNICESFAKIYCESFVDCDKIHKTFTIHNYSEGVSVHVIDTWHAPYTCHSLRGRPYDPGRLLWKFCETFARLLWKFCETLADHL